MWKKSNVDNLLEEQLIFKYSNNYLDKIPDEVKFSSLID